MLTIVSGPMFAGKTTWLLEYVKRLPQGSFQLFKPAMDTRYAIDECVTHDGQHLAALNLDALQPVFPQMSTQVSTILIDELNFFKPETLLLAITEQQKLGRHVIGCGLLLDVKKQAFGATLPLSKVADEWITLQATCDRCHQPASQSYSKVSMSGQVRLGAGDTYGACCDTCWDVLQKAD